MSKRLVSWIKSLKKAGFSNNDIAAELNDGEIPRPKWLAGTPDGEAWKLWDLDEKDCIYYLSNKNQKIRREK